MIPIKTSQEQQSLRASGSILASVMKALSDMVEPGIKLLDLENKAAELIEAAGAIPAFKGYRGYPNILCTSVNNEVVHCVPTEKKLKTGDIISIDNGVFYKGMYSDCAITLPVGEVSKEAEKLIQVTKDSLYKAALPVIKPGKTIGDIGAAVQEFVEVAGYSVIRSLVGHGIGKELHEDPSIPNFGKAGTGIELKPGMAIAVEPMVNIGDQEVIFKEDGWTVVTKDGSLSAHFEHTFLITKKGCEIITKF